jgi:hypothetical protein
MLFVQTNDRTGVAYETHGAGGCPPLLENRALLFAFSL